MDAETPTVGLPLASWRYFGATLKNTRGYENQDAAGHNPHTFVVADGVSRSSNPAAAAQAAVKVALLERVVDTGAAWAHSVILGADVAASEARGLTTVTGLRFIETNAEYARLVVFQVGDSMLLRVRGTRVERVTEMHSFVEGLVKAGYLTPAQAKRDSRSNVITSALGHLADKQVRRLKVSTSDALVLCTDGVHGLLEGADILRCLQAENPAQALCDAGQAAGSSDDATAIVLFGPRYVSPSTVG